VEPVAERAVPGELEHPGACRRPPRTATSAPTPPAMRFTAASSPLITAHKVD
jgi:hypothetical protein